jgi:Leucine-rich repeat (LRR) protein
MGDGLVTAAISNSNLKCLHFWNINFQDEEARSALVSGLRQNSTLQKVRFEDCGLTDAQVSQIAEALQSNPSLRELYLSETECGVQGTKALANLASKNRKLENLTLASNGILASPIHPLVKSLKGHPGLSDADLGNNLIVEVLSTCPRLETLDLYGNKLTHDGLELLASQPQPKTGIIQ